MPQMLYIEHSTSNVQIMSFLKMIKMMKKDESVYWMTERIIPQKNRRKSWNERIARRSLDRFRLSGRESLTDCNESFLLDCNRNMSQNREYQPELLSLDREKKVPERGVGNIHLNVYLWIAIGREKPFIYPAYELTKY